jgi:hypothetical protein
MWGEHALRVLVHSAVRRIFDPEKEEMMGGWRNCIFMGLVNHRKQIKLYYSMDRLYSSIYSYTT